MVHITTPKVKQEKSIKLKVVQHQNRDVKWKLKYLWQQLLHSISSVLNELLDLRKEHREGW